MSEARVAPHWRYHSLREWITEADRLGELRTVVGASWQEEIGLAADVVVPPEVTRKAREKFGYLLR